MITSIKVRLQPNNKQLTKLFQYAGCARFAYNWAINREQENHKRGDKFLSDNELRKEFTQLKNQQHLWLKNVSNNVTKQAIKDACNAYKQFSKDIVDIRNLRARNIPHHRFIKTRVKSNLLIPM